MRKGVSIILTGVFLSTLLSVGVFTATAGLEEKLFEEYTYNLLDDQVTIVDVDTAISGDVEIPSTIEGYPVTGIDERAFDGCDQIVTLKIPSKVAVIAETAFEECTSLTAFTVGLTSKSFCARDGVLFNYDKTTLICYPAGKTDTSYAIPDGVTRIDAVAFGYASKLESVSVADGVEKIGERAFAECSGMKQIVFGVGLTEIGSEAFSGCKSLEAVTIPNSVTSLGHAAFSECHSLAKVTFGKGLTSLNGTMFLNCTALKSVGIPDTMTTILPSAFAGCSSLKTITIPKSVTSIGSYVFYKCTNLKTVSYTGSEEDRSAMKIGAKNESLDAAEWQYGAPSVKTPANDTPVGPQPDTSVDWRWAVVGGFVILLAAAVVAMIVLLARGIKKRK